jgi:dynein light chain roadblock-type
MSEVEETLERIKNHKGVEGYVIADRNGNVLRRHPQMQVAEAEKYALYMKELTTKARGVVRDLNPKNDLQYMRIRIKKLELLIAHGNRRSLCSPCLTGLLTLSFVLKLLIQRRTSWSW